MNEEAKKIMEEGWKARENLEFDRADKLLNRAKNLFEESGDWFNVTEALNHLAYTEKLRAEQHNLKGMELVREADGLAGQHSTKRILILRALMSLAESSGLYEQGIKYTLEYLQENLKPMPKADAISHLATFQLRTGNLPEAEKAIDEAETIVRTHFEEEREPHRSIWKSRILATKGLILYNRGKFNEAKKYLEESLDIAVKENLKSRQRETKALLDLFN